MDPALTNENCSAGTTGSASPATITNPILRGFNPDPSIVRVGEDYYIATSTFEWFPGVQIHHSRDLIHWRLLTRPLRRANQLNMLGDPDSCGIWAPCLTHADGLFWLIYTDVKRYGRTTVGGASGASLRDFHNYLVTSPRVDGDWSDPISLNSSGFDPSLFHDDDGRKYLLNMLWDHRPGNNRFAGIVLQEYSVQETKLIGQRQTIFTGTPLGFTEAPHLYKRNGWYYLLTAEARKLPMLPPLDLCRPNDRSIPARWLPHGHMERIYSGHREGIELVWNACLGRHGRARESRIPSVCLWPRLRPIWSHAGNGTDLGATAKKCAIGCPKSVIGRK
jgi:Glycosyl hydrolases family 43